MARDERRGELAQAYEADRLLQEQRDRLAQELDETRDRTRQASGPGPLNVDSLLGMHRHELLLAAQQQQMDQQHQQLVEEIERRRQRLVEADRHVKSLEKLREKQSERHLYAQSVIEQKQFDETASQRAANRCEL